MNLLKSIAGALLILGVVGGMAHGDDLRNVKKGEAVPAFRMSASDGTMIDSTLLRGKVVVLVYLSAEQKSSEQAAGDSSEVMKKFDEAPVTLVHATADIVHKPYFDRFRAEREIKAPLGLDTGRRLYGDLGLIVFPTTIITDKEGVLRHVISTRSPDYPWILECSIRHTLGEFDDATLAERLKSRGPELGSPKSLAARHRSAARLLREKGLNDAARGELLRAREYDPEDPNITLDLADIDLSTGHAAEARSLAAGILEHNPAHRRAQEIAGVAMFKLGDIDAARTILTESIMLNPSPARALYYLGRIDEAQGRGAEAMKRYREALERVLGE